MLITLTWIAIGLGGVMFLGAVLGYLVILLAAQDLPHDRSRHTGWEDR